MSEDEPYTGCFEDVPQSSDETSTIKNSTFQLLQKSAVHYKFSVPVSLKLSGKFYAHSFRQTVTNATKSPPPFLRIHQNSGVASLDIKQSSFLKSIKMC